MNAARTLLDVLLLTLAAAAVGVLAGWFVVQLATDRFELTQILFWVPDELVVAPAAAALVLGPAVLVTGRWRRRASGRGRTPARRTRGVLAALCLAGAVAGPLWLLLADWRVLNTVLPGPRPVPNTTTVSFFHCNQSASGYHGWRDITPRFTESPLNDVYLLTVATNPATDAGVRDALTALSPDRPYANLRSGQFAVFSRLPIMRYGHLGLRLGGRDTAEAPAWEPARLLKWVYSVAARRVNLAERSFTRVDPGQIFWLELDATPQLGRPIIVWFIDLPSSPMIPRAAIARGVAERIDRLIEVDLLPVAPGAQQPDVLIGDFNIPRRSWSLGVIAHDMHHAFDQASWGNVASWPRQRPLLHIDHTFLAPWLGAVRYEIVDLGVGEHLGQSATVVRRR